MGIPAVLDIQACDIAAENVRDVCPAEPGAKAMIDTVTHDIDQDEVRQNALHLDEIEMLPARQAPTRLRTFLKPMLVTRRDHRTLRLSQHARRFVRYARADHCDDRSVRRTCADRRRPARVPIIECLPRSV